MATIDFEKSKGYVIVPSYFTLNQIESIRELINIDELSRKAKKNDVFYTEDLNDKVVKQIQHLEIFDDIKKIGDELIKNFHINGEIVNMQIFIKHPNYKITKPHQDGAYFKSDKYLTFWIPLQDVDEMNSCLYYLDDSHRLGLLEHNETGSVVRNRTGVTGLSLEYKYTDLSQYSSAKMKKGDIVCHHPYTLHYSSKNNTKEIRVALTCIVKLT